MEAPGEEVETSIVMYTKSLQSCPTLRPCGLQTARLLCPWDSPGKNPGLVAISSSRGPSQPRDGTWISYVSCLGRRVLYHQHHLGVTYTQVAEEKLKIPMTFNFTDVKTTHTSLEMVAVRKHKNDLFNVLKDCQPILCKTNRNMLLHN